MVLGIWAEEEDDYNARPSFGQKSLRQGGPVRFVTGGIANGTKKVNLKSLFFLKILI